MRSQNETRGSRFRRASIAAAMMLGLSAGAARADLLAYWNFNTDNDPSGGVQSGTASLDFANISGPITSFGGSTINANGGDAAGSSLAFQVGSGNVGNGQSFDINFSMAGFTNLQLSYAAQGTSTGFTDVDISWSTGGSTFTDFVNDIDYDSFSLQQFGVPSNIDNASNVTLRFTMSGGSGSSGNNRYDNIQLNADAVGSAPTILTFDADTGAADAQDGNGTWVNGGNAWYADSAQQSWDNAVPNSAIFGSGAGGNGGAGVTVTVSAPVTAQDVTFAAASTDEYTVTGSQVNLEGNLSVEKTATINSNVKLGGNNIIDVAAGQTLTLGGALSEDGPGLGNASIQGAGKVVVTGDSSSTGYEATVTLTGPVTFEVAAGGNTGLASINSTSGSNAVFSGDGAYGGGVNVFNATLEGNSTVGTDFGGGFVIGDSTVSGAITPGYDSGDTSGKLTFLSNLRLFSTTYNWNLTALKDDADGVAGANWDLLKVNGDLYDGSGSGTSTFSLNITNDIDPAMADTFWNTNHSWLIADVGTNGSTSGFGVDFATINGSPIGFSTRVDAGGDIYLDYTSGIIAPSGTGKIAVTEFIQNPNGDDGLYEWVEIYNYDDHTISLDGWHIEDEDSDIFALPDFDLAAGEFAILTTDEQAFIDQWLGGVDNGLVFETSNFFLANGGDEIIIRDADGNIVWRLAYGNDDQSGYSFFLADNDFTNTEFGAKGGDLINPAGTDAATGTLGYEANTDGYLDGNGSTNANGDYGSPFSLASLPSVVPEPTSLALFGLALAGLTARRRR